MQQGYSDVKSKIPARAGVGLREMHYEDALANKAEEHKAGIHWFEFHPENYMGGGGVPHYFLAKIAERFPLSMHGVGLSIGGAGPLDAEHLERLKELDKRYQPQLVSEHLAWSTHESRFMNDLLPLPFNAETLQVVCDHLDQLQNYLGRQVLLENPSSYLSFQDSDMDEVMFLSEVAKQTGCGLLLDINNVFVSAHNMGWNAIEYVDAFPLGKVGEIHLAGHQTEILEDGESLLIDTHDRPVAGSVWDIYKRVVEKAGCIPTLIEWDAEIPAWPVLFEEGRRADVVLMDIGARAMKGNNYAVAS